MRISDWSSDVCSSDLAALNRGFLIRLAETAKAIVADDGSAARDGDGVAALVLGVRRRRKRRGGEKHAEARAGKSLHDGQILAGCGSSLPAALRAGLCRGPVLSDSLSFGETAAVHNHKIAFLPKKWAMLLTYNNFIMK